MEENSELHMETDVSSTTGDVLDDQETTESHMDVFIVVEEAEEPGSSAISSQSEDGVIHENTLSSEPKSSPQNNMQIENVITSPCNDAQMRELNEKSSTTEQIQETSNDSHTSSKLQASEEGINTPSNAINTKKDMNEIGYIESNISSTPEINISENSPVKEIFPDKSNSPIKVSADRIKVLNLASMEKLRTPTKISLVRTKPNVDSIEGIKSPIKVSPDRINTEFSDKVSTKVSLVRKRSANLISLEEMTPIIVSPEKSNAESVDITKKINTPPKVSPDKSNTESSGKTQTPTKVSLDRNNMDIREKTNTTSKISLVRRRSAYVTSSEEIKTPTKASPNKTDITNTDCTVKTNSLTKVSLDITNSESTEKTKAPIKVSLTRTRSVNLISAEEKPTKVSPTKYTTKDLTEKNEPPTKVSPGRIDAECLEKVIPLDKDSTDNIITSIESEGNSKTQNKECNENLITPNQESVRKLNSQSIESLDNERTTSPTKECIENLITNQETPEKKIKTPEQDKIKTPNKEILKPNVVKKEDKKETNSNNIVDICEKSNDSQTNLDMSEKEHNKSISRELKSLIKSAKESKIISECTQLTSKTRKTRVALDSSITSPNTSLEAEKIQAIRRSSINSQRSNCSEKSEKVLIKRSMRSQNPEFVFKVKKFLNSVTGKNQKGESDDEEEKKENVTDSASPLLKKKKNEIPIPEMSPGRNKLRSDPYCWRCHWLVEPTTNEKGHPPLQCTVCPRAFHYKCLSGTERNKINVEKSWVCPECLSVLHAESSETRSAAMKKISLGDLCEMLHHALQRMMDLNGVEAFMQPVDRTAFPDYEKYVVHPMDLTLMKQNITDGHYGSTEAFLADAQWILHNSIIFNTCMYEDKLQSKLTSGARALIRSCRAEMGEIEACPQCYAAAHARRPTWFIDVCSTPHILLWAKLKGFPFWPAKGMSVSSTGLVDVRFFGAHDRAWVPARDCFLFCEKDPNNFRTKRQDILDSMQEAELHIRNISRKYGKFVYPPFKTQFDPAKLSEQLKMMIPSFDGEIMKPTQVKDKTFSSPTAKGKSRSNSKSSKSSFNDGDISENEDIQVTDSPSRKMADGAVIAKEDAADVCDKEKPMEVEVPIGEKEATRKRRRSELEEAVLTVIETSNAKRPKLEVENEKKIKEPEKMSQQNTVRGTENTAMEVDPTVVDPKVGDPKAVSEKPKDKINEKVTKENTEVVKEKSKEALIKNNTTETASEVKKTPTKLDIKVKSTRSSTTKEKDDKPSTPKQRPSRTDKSTPAEKIKQEDKVKTPKRGNSKNFSVNDSPVPKDKKTDSVNGKDRNKESNGPKNKESEHQKEKIKVTTDSPKTKNKMQFDDDTSLAVIAREVAKTNTGLPTISSVRSLSTVVPTEANMTNKTAEVTVIAESDSSIFTATSTDNVRNMKEAVNMQEKLRNEFDTTLVGKVGVRAFARIKSPEKKTPTESFEVAIKSEPIDVDFEDADRQSEKLNLMNAFRLRPVHPTNLRGVRINKVVVSPLAKKTGTKSPEVRANLKAKKTFPTPRKVDDGRSELNSKNSMVYIPIQPPASQAPPVRPSRPITVNGSNIPHTVRPQVSSSISNVSTINTVSSPLVPMSSISTATIVSNSLTNPICMPTVGQFPFITSVNGQWTFSLQPVMSVGGIDGTPTPPVVNGVPERSIQNNAVVPLATPSIQPTILNPMGQPLQIQPAQTQAAKPNSSTDATPGEPPRLYQRPPLHNPLDSNTPQSTVTAPSYAGPLTAKLNQNAVKLTDFFKNLLEDSLDKIEEPASQVTSLKLQLEQMQWRHQQEVKELKHNHDLTISEMRASYEKAIARSLNDARRTAQTEVETAIKNAKSKQWCANCSQEAQFYCCWNTSYCDYACQKAHWPHHYNQCTQQRSQNNNGNESGSGIEKRLQPAPDSLPRSAQAPTLTVGAKLTRPFQDPHQKTSIIVSMVEDKSGNPTVKCLGTYKPATPLVQPVIINKQILTSEETSKVVTSGGYLIVGAGNGSQSIVTSQRRQHTIQYFS